MQQITSPRQDVADDDEVTRSSMAVSIDVEKEDEMTDVRFFFLNSVIFLIQFFLFGRLALHFFALFLARGNKITDYCMKFK